MTKISYFGKQNSTLGSVVPLEIFVAIDAITRYLNFKNRNLHVPNKGGWGGGGG